MDTTPHQMQTCSNMHPKKNSTIKWIIWLRFLSILCFAASHSFTHLIARLERREFLHVCLCRGYPDCYLKINTRKLGILSCVSVHVDKHCYVDMAHHSISLSCITVWHHESKSMSCGAPPGTMSLRSFSATCTQNDVTICMDLWIFGSLWFRHVWRSVM